MIRIAPLTAGRGAACAALLAALPDWFGQPESNAAYVRDVETMACWAAWDGDELLGFVALCAHRGWSREIHVMGVRPGQQRSGVGRALVAAAEAAARADGVRWLLVKTLGPSHPDPHYARTRAFYEAVGFEPLEELLDLWPGNPCLLMIKPLG